MGIRFTTNTWRAPLQLIDCWLPVHESVTAAPAMPTPRLLQRFAKAGWLSRSLSVNAPRAAEPSRKLQPPRHPRLAELQRRSASAQTSASKRVDGRLVLSGRIDQVCAELERLAAMEQRMFQ